MTTIFFAIFVVQALYWKDLSNGEKLENHFLYFGPILISIFLIALFRLIKWMDEISTVTELILDRESSFEDIGQYSLFYLRPRTLMQRIGFPRNIMGLTTKQGRVLLFCPRWRGPFELEEHYTDSRYDGHSIVDERKWPAPADHKCHECYIHPNSGLVDSFKNKVDSKYLICELELKFSEIIEFDKKGDSIQYKNRIKEIREIIGNNKW